VSSTTPQSTPIRIWIGSALTRLNRSHTFWIVVAHSTAAVVESNDGHNAAAQVAKAEFYPSISVPAHGSCRN
jgi:hypothetical protein